MQKCIGTEQFKAFAFIKINKNDIDASIRVGVKELMRQMSMVQGEKGK